MNKRIHIFQNKACLLALWAMVLASGCALQKQKPQVKLEGFHQVKFLSMMKIPHNEQFQNTTIGGLSSIDYDAAKDQYYMVCDDRSELNPARFYTAKIEIKDYQISAIKFIKVDSLRDQNKALYPSMSDFKAHPQQQFNTPDPEELRYHAPSHRMVWSSEGERILGEKNIIEQPAITYIDTMGRYLSALALPPQLKMTAENYGPRQNGVLEGLSFTPDGQQLFASVEEPLYQDGPRADVMAQNTWCRLLQYDAKEGKLQAQYAYPLGKVVHKPFPRNAFKLNGIPSILALNNHQLLVLERSFSMGHLQSNIRVYLTDLQGATDINAIDALANAKGKFTAASKKLVIDFDTLGVYIDNVEGITFGPTLPNGNRTLLFVSDNNFNKLEKSQVFLFELLKD